MFKFLLFEGFINESWHECILDFLHYCPSLPKQWFWITQISNILEVLPLTNFIFFSVFYVLFLLNCYLSLCSWKSSPMISHAVSLSHSFKSTHSVYHHLISPFIITWAPRGQENKFSRLYSFGSYEERNWCITCA